MGRFGFMGRESQSLARKKKKKAVRCWASASVQAGPQAAAGRMAGRGLFNHRNSFFIFHFIFRSI
jgi:hypothetical protein